MPHLIQALPGNLSFRLIFINGGTFNMGSNESEDSKPVHEVTIPDFYMAEFVVTQAIYEAVMSNNPSRFKGAQKPVEKVTWHNAQAFIATLNTRDKPLFFETDAPSLPVPWQKTINPPNNDGIVVSTGRYALPSEAQWEYAARGGRLSRGFKYAGTDKLKESGWYVRNSHGETKDTGLKMPNELGLYDMSGNVFEWCQDQWHDNYKGASKDGTAWEDSSDNSAIRVMRGGSWNNHPDYCAVSYRYYNLPDYDYDFIGFRVVFLLV